MTTAPLLVEFAPAMRKVRMAMKRGRATEQGIGRYTGFDAQTVRVTLGLLSLLGEVEQREDGSWQGITLATAPYGRRIRRYLEAKAARERTAVTPVSP